MAVLALLGGIYSTGQTLGHIEDKLDRNCRLLGEVNADVEYLVVIHTDPDVAADLRRINRAQAMESCG